MGRSVRSCLGIASNSFRCTLSDFTASKLKGKEKYLAEMGNGRERDRASEQVMKEVSLQCGFWIRVKFSGIFHPLSLYQKK